MINRRRSLVLLAFVPGLLPALNIYWELFERNIFFELWPSVKVLAWPVSILLRIFWYGDSPLNSTASVSFDVIVMDWTVFTITSLLFWIAAALVVDRLLNVALGETPRPFLKVRPSQIVLGPGVPFPRIAAIVLAVWRSTSLKSGVIGTTSLLGLVPALDLFIKMTYRFHYQEERFWPATEVLGWPARQVTRLLAPDLLPSLAPEQSSRIFLVSWSAYLALNLYLWLCVGLLVAWTAEALRKRQI